MLAVKYSTFVPDGRTGQAHERVPFLLIADSSQTCCDGVLARELLETLQRLIVSLYGLRKLEVALCVFVAIVYDCLVWKRGEVLERSVHLWGCTLEEAATAGDEERVAREYAARVRPIVRGNVVADGVLGMAGGMQAPVLRVELVVRANGQGTFAYLILTSPKFISSLSWTRLVNAGALLLPP